MLADDFWSRCKWSGDCLEWSLGRNRLGYGHVKIRGKTRMAHRVAWTIHNGKEIPEGLWILHSCDNPPCCNPKHLRLGTPQDNSDDCVSRGRCVGGAGPPGERNGKSKIKENDVWTIRSMHASGSSYARIGRLFGLSRQHIRRIVLGKTWKYLHESNDYDQGRSPVF